MLIQFFDEKFKADSAYNRRDERRVHFKISRSKFKGKMKGYCRMRKTFNKI